MSLSERSHREEVALDTLETRDGGDSEGFRESRGGPSRQSTAVLGLWHSACVQTRRTHTESPPRGNAGLWVIMMSRCRFVDCAKPSRGRGC